MPKSCCAFGCHSHNMKGENVSFHVFPVDTDRRAKWIAAVRRKDWLPTKNSVLCGKHFLTGKPNRDPCHPDYVPSVFVYSSPREKLQPKLARYQAVRNRKVMRELLPPNETVKENLMEVDHMYFKSIQVPDTSVASKTSPEPTQNTCPETPVEPPVSVPEPDPGVACALEMAALRAERDTLKKDLEVFKMSHLCIKEDDKKSHFYVGLPWAVFFTTFQFLARFINSTNKRFVLKPIDQFFLTLVKLRMDLPFELISNHAGVGRTTVIDIFWRWVDLMHAKLKFLIRWPDKEALIQTTPAAFKCHFPRLTGIIDCFEIFMESPKSLLARAQCYSNYKKHCTVKVFIVCSPLGSVSYISSSWGGRASDVEIVRESGFIGSRFHMPGDQILADRGFTLHEDFAMQNLELITPSFTKGKKQLSAKEVETSRKISSVRIHIERVIGLVKNRYTILQGTLPVQVVKSLKDETRQLKPASIDKILVSCAALTNLGTGIVSKTNV